VEAIKPLFERFDAALRGAGYIAMGGQIVDATLVSAPKQYNTEDEKKAIREGRVPENWKAQPAKVAHKDRDARLSGFGSKPLSAEGGTVKFSKAKERADARSRLSTSPFPPSAIRTMLLSTANTA